MVINFATSIVLARLLTPAEIGIFSVAFVFAGLLRTIRELGIGAYIVQEPDLTEERLRSAFGVAIFVSLLTAGAVAVLAPFVGTFYRESGITSVLLVVAATFVLAPLGSTTLALLRRDMRFKEISIAELFATVIQSIAGVALAWLGFSYMSLAWSSLIGIIASVLIAMYYRPASTPWLPGFAEWRRVWSFCRFASASSLIGNMNGAASDLVLGRMLNMESVALFNRAQSLADLIGPILFRAINAVSLPYFVKAKKDGDDLGELYFRSSALMAAISLPTYCVLGLLAKPIVQLLYGAPWVGSIPILQILCFAAVIRAPIALSTQILTAIGQVKRLFVLDCQALVVKVALAIAAAPFGLQMVAWSFCLSSLLLTLQRVHVTATVLKTRRIDAWRAVATSFLPSALASVGPLALIQTDLSPLVLLPVAGLLAAVGWLAGALIQPGHIKDEILRLRSQRPSS